MKMFRKKKVALAAAVAMWIVSAMNASAETVITGDGQHYIDMSVRQDLKIGDGGNTPTGGYFTQQNYYTNSGAALSGWTVKFDGYTAQNASTGPLRFTFRNNEAEVKNNVITIDNIDFGSVGNYGNEFGGMWIGYNNTNSDPALSKINNNSMIINDGNFWTEHVQNNNNQISLIRGGYVTTKEMNNNSLTINGGTFSDVGSMGVIWGSYARDSANNTITINDGYFDNVKVRTYTMASKYPTSSDHYLGTGNNTYINGGTFVNGFFVGEWGNYTNATNNIYVTGGTFSNTGTNTDGTTFEALEDVSITGGTFNKMNVRGGKSVVIQDIKVGGDSTSYVDIGDMRFDADDTFETEFKNIEFTTDEAGMDITNRRVNWTYGGGEGADTFNVSNISGTGENTFRIERYENVSADEVNDVSLSITSVEDSGTISITNSDLANLTFSSSKSSGITTDVSIKDSTVTNTKGSTSAFSLWDGDFSMENSSVKGNISKRSGDVNIISGSKIEGNFTQSRTSEDTNEYTNTLKNSEITGSYTGTANTTEIEGMTIGGNFSDTGIVYDLKDSTIGGNYAAGNENVYEISDQTFKISNSTVAGGATMLNAKTVENSTFTISDSSLSATSGGKKLINGKTKASGNTVNINNSALGNISGSPSVLSGGEVLNNTVNVTDSTISGSLFSFFNGGVSGLVKGNTVTIDADSTVNAKGFYLATSQEIQDNTMNLYTMDGLNANTTIGASSYGTSYTVNHTNNTLNVKNVLNATIKNLRWWDNINFYVPASAQSGDTIFNIADYSVDMRGVNIRAGIDGDMDFNAGDYINLIKAGYISTDDSTTYGTLTSGVSTIYEGLTVKKKDDTSIILTIPSNTPDPDPDPDPTPPDPIPDPDPDPDPDPTPPLPPVIPIHPPVMRRINPETQSLLSGQVAATEIIEEAVEIADAVRDAETGDYIFGVISASAINGNDVSSRNTHFAVGYKKADEERIAAAYVQYGRGSYSSDIQGIDASGNTDYIGIG